MPVGPMAELRLVAGHAAQPIPVQTNLFFLPCFSHAPEPTRYGNNVLLREKFLCYDNETWCTVHAPCIYFAFLSCAKFYPINLHHFFIPCYVRFESRSCGADAVL